MATKMTLMQSLSPACRDGDHDRCKCLLPGQDRRWAGLLLDFDEATETFKPVGFCGCECHDDEKRAP